MRVRYIMMLFPAGAETFACTDIRTLIAAGVDVAVYSMRRQRPNARELLAQRWLDGLRVDYATLAGSLLALVESIRHLPWALGTLAWVIWHTWSQPRHLVVSLCLFPRAIEIALRIRREAPDVLHLFWGHYPSMVGHLVRRSCPDVVISTFLGAYDLECRYPPSAALACAADVVWTHAYGNADQVAALGIDRERIQVVHRGVDLTAFSGAVQKTPRRVVCAARLCVDKHVDDVIRAFAELVGEFPDASLVVMGDGPDRRRLESLSRSLGVAKHVQFTGHIAQTAVRDHMRAADVFMMMSRETTDVLPNAVKEAMVCGCVCIVSRTPLIEELITGGRHGFVVPPADVAAAARTLRWVFSNGVATESMRAAAVRRIHAEFDVTRAMDAYRHRWQELLRTRTQPEYVGGRQRRTAALAAASPSQGISE